MATNNFFLVPQIVATDKYFDVSIPEMLRAVSSTSGKFERSEEQLVADEYGVEHPVLMRLNVNCQSVVPQGWTVALKLHKIRVDGIDWEQDFDAIDGTKGHGWHRHQWNQRKQDAKDSKIPLADFDNVDAREQFLIRALSLLKIKWNKVDYGDQLSMGEGPAA